MITYFEKGKIQVQYPEDGRGSTQFAVKPVDRQRGLPKTSFQAEARRCRLCLCKGRKIAAYTLRQISMSNKLQNK
jgi:hypothetical protein